MISLRKLALTALVIGFSSTTVTAKESDLTLGIKTGEFKSGINILKDRSASGISLAYNVTDNWAAEFSILNGSLGTPFGGSGDFDVNTIAFYGTYRSDGEIYFMGKAGFLSEEIDSESDSGLSVGLGAGYRLTDNFSLELEYTVIEGDINFLGLGGYYTF